MKKIFILLLIAVAVSVVWAADYTPYSTDMYGLENPIYNADFERPVNWMKGTKPVPSYWSLSNTDYISIDYTESAGSGDASMIFAVDSMPAGTGIWADVSVNSGKWSYLTPVDPNELLVVKFKVKMDAGGISPAGNRTEMQILPYNDVTFLNLYSVNPITIDTPGVWEEKTYFINMNDFNNDTLNRVGVRFYIDNVAGGLFTGDWRFDEIEVYALPETKFDTLGYMAEDWLSNEALALNSDYVIDDFEDYIPVPSGPNIYEKWFRYSNAAQDRGNPQLYLATDPVEGDQCIQFDYDNDSNLGKPGIACWNEISRVFTEAVPNGIDFSQYDELHFKIYRAAGNSYEKNIYFKFYENEWTGDLKLFNNYAANPMEGPLSGTTQSPAGVWEEVVIDLHKIKQLDTRTIADMTNVTGFMFGLSANSKWDWGTTDYFGTGTLYLDDIKLVQTKPECSASVSGADLNGDCEVDLLDSAILAHTWLRQP